MRRREVIAGLALGAAMGRARAQQTANEILRGDWSSAVCSSDLVGIRTSPRRTSSDQLRSASVPASAAARGGISSATTRPRSVTSTVSPAAAARICRLSSFFRALMPTLRMANNVATRGYVVNAALTARAHEVIA